MVGKKDAVYTENPEIMNTTQKQRLGIPKPILEKFIIVCSFFLIAGFLNCYSFISNAEEQKRSFIKEKNVLFDKVIGLWHIDFIDHGEWAEKAKVYAIAKMFGANSTHLSSALLQSGLTVSNLWVALYLAIKNEDLNLKKGVHEFLLENANATLHNKTWRDGMINSVLSSYEILKIVKGPDSS
ncbi:hypothetical protein NPIL_50011 [Nephila pilipes]|uniref:Uncharacterized protein n=1 Tax=Nephila pilipes TaxID=299642 RepID=A0A8X6NLV2_NEPPI|nr:hypothetical protein NPIL_50011 [Nephila pilipes]